MGTDTPHALYRFYGDDGRLLYVGITKNPGHRFDQHSDSKDWWHEVRGISVEWYPDRNAVTDAERRAIDIERPVYNLQRPALRKNGHKAGVHKPRNFVWTCEECKCPIADGDGYIHVSYMEINENQAAWRQFNDAERERAKETGGWHAMDLRALMELPDEARWRVHHRKCDPEPDSSDYWFGVERARTHAHLLDWTAHLLESKDWLEATNWHRLLRRMATVNA